MRRQIIGRHIGAGLVLALLLSGCGGESAQDQAPDARASSTDETCRPFARDLDDSDREPPNLTIRSCLCADAPSIQKASDIKGVGPYFLSSKRWDDAYLCSGDLHLVYGNVAVDFESVSGLRARDEAVRATERWERSWGGRATELHGYPAYVKPPDLGEGAVGEVLILVDGLMLRLIGNPSASTKELVALAKTFDLTKRRT